MIVRLPSPKGFLFPANGEIERGAKTIEDAQRAERGRIKHYKIMIKKEYIQPTVKEVEIKLPTILAGSIKNPDTEYSMNENDDIDSGDPISAGDGL